MEKVISGVKIELLKGDISAQADVSAIVNAANAQLRIGGGVAGAIHRAAGPGLEEECRPLAPIRPGEAVITGAHNLSNDYVIHCLGPVYGLDKPERKLLENCYRNAIILAEENRVSSVAFPAISAGAFGYPVKQAAEVAIETVLGMIPEMRSLILIRIVLFSESDLTVFSKILSSK